MTIDFVLIGIYFIWLVFYYEKNKGNIPLFLGVFLLLLGYFIKPIIVGDVFINICNVVGIVSLFAFVFTSKKVNVKKSITSGVLISFIYGLINLIDMDFNLFFGAGLTIVVIIIINFLNCLLVEECVVSALVGLVLIEIFNIFFMLPKLEFVTIFGDVLVLCIGFAGYPPVYRNRP